MAGLGWITVALSVVLCGVCVVLAAPFVFDAVGSMQRVIRIRSNMTGAGNRQKNQTEGTTKSTGELLWIDLCTNGIKFCRVPARLLAKLPAGSRVANSVVVVLAQRIPGCNSRAVLESLLFTGVLSGLIVFVLTGQIVLAFAALALPFAVAQAQAQKSIQTRQNQLRDQLPDALRGLGMCFMAGLSLEQAFDQAAMECREPLRKEMQRTVDDLRTGSSVMEALDALDKRLVMDEMKFVSVALEIQHQTGGSMREVLDAAAESMLASFDLSRSLEVQTAQARMSARVVSILPLALVLVLSVAMEGYLATFFSSIGGFVLLLLAVGMEIAGILIIRRILGIDLE